MGYRHSVGSTLISMTGPTDSHQRSEEHNAHPFDDASNTDESYFDGEVIETPRTLRSRWKKSPASLITDTPRSAYENRRKREIIYLLIQFSRVPMVLIGAAAWYWWDLWWLFLFMVLLSIPAPGVSVVIANEKGEKRDSRQQSVYKPGVARQMSNQIELERQRAAQLESGSAKALNPGTSDPADPIVIDKDPSDEPIIIDADDNNPE